MHKTDPGETYLQVVKDQLHKLEDDLLVEDIDILCQYIVLRFLKTSPEVHGEVPPEEINEKLNVFVQGIYSLLVTFITVVNSSPLEKRGGDA